ncbi:uncharacterized protein [Asterias amurensis]|uniref:uncharacterized protein isoform X2 n=1 Tax=Asterias amurensis TaxID=7602 RepID=UPI003AB1734F
MGNLFTRCAHRLTVSTGADAAEEGNTENQRAEMATNHPENISDEGRKVFLHNPDDKETDGVYFGVNLQQQDGRFVFKDFQEGGLAYKTGFRSGDMLVSANSIDIGKVDLMQLLKKLLDYKEFNYFIGIKRKLDDGTNTFIWKIFKITTKDGVPEVAVLETLENDTDLMPDTSFTPSTPTYDFIRVTDQTFNIYIEDDQAPTKYLTITGNKQLVFQDYDESSDFKTCFQPTTTVRQLLVSPKDKTAKNDHTGVVYQIPCQGQTKQGQCTETYIGKLETERSLKKHRRPSSSSSEVSQHIHSVTWPPCRHFQSNYFRQRRKIFPNGS